jgi:drug/metabolite transporter (DMT)-like permease
VRAPASTAFALGAIALWGTLAALAASLREVPPFLLVGLALCLGSLAGARSLLRAPPPPRAFALGLYGIFGYHLCLFLALRWAPAVEANLVNYLWPLLIVVLAPAIVPGLAWSARHAAAAALGFAGVTVLVVTGGGLSGGGSLAGYGLALVAAVIWSTYSLASRRFAHFPTGWVAWFCLASGLAALACHVAFEPRYGPSASQWPAILAMGLGPLGAAFFLWDRAMKTGDPRVIGTLAYVTPLVSTGLLVAFAGGTLAPGALAALALILGGAAWGQRAGSDARPSGSSS